MRQWFPTWRWQNGLAMWSFSLPGRAGESAAATLLRTVRDATRGLEGFARVADVSLTTAEGGEDAVVLEDPAGVGAEAVESAILGAGDVEQVTMSLDLVVTLEPGAEPVVLDGGAALWLELMESSQSEAVVVLTLSLDIDIYSPVSWGERRENDVLAEINGPRLSAFLSRVTQQLSGRMTLLHAEAYEGLVDEAGFHPAKDG